MKLKEAIRVTERKLRALKRLLPVSESVDVCVNEWIQLSDSDMDAVAALMETEVHERDIKTSSGETIHEQYVDLDGMEIICLVEVEKKPGNVPL